MLKVSYKVTSLMGSAFQIKKIILVGRFMGGQNELGPRFKTNEGERRSMLG